MWSALSVCAEIVGNFHCRSDYQMRFDISNRFPLTCYFFFLISFDTHLILCTLHICYIWNAVLWLVQETLNSGVENHWCMTMTGRVYIWIHYLLVQYVLLDHFLFHLSRLLWYFLHTDISADRVFSSRISLGNRRQHKKSRRQCLW